MATNTPKLTLPKPDANDNFNRAAYNALIDAIDTNVGTKTQAADAHIADSTKHVTAADKAKWDAGQLFKLTTDTGLTKQNVADLNSISSAGTFYAITTTLNKPPGAGDFLLVEQYYADGTETAIQRATDIVKSEKYLRTRTSSGWKPWRKLTDTNLLGNVILGNKFVDQSNANFVGKVAGSTAANPHTAGYSVSTSIMSNPSATSEDTQANYNSLSSTDGSLRIISSNSQGSISQNRYSFNLIEHVQRTYGTIPGATTADKVAWLKSNLSKLTFNWWGFGASPAGNKATIARWGVVTSAWGTLNFHQSSSVQKISTNDTNGNNIDNNGFIHYLAYADASDGTTPSVINTDYVELQVELSTDIKTNIPNATPSNAGLQSGADKTKLDGISAAANRVTNPAVNGSIAIDGINAVIYAHPTGDGNSHVPATGTANNGKVLKAGATANAFSWAFVDWSEIINKPSTYLPSAHTHAIADVTGLSAALTNKIETSQRGAVNGVASLGSDGKVPTAQLPTISNAATDITVTDTANYFASTSVEGALAEVGQVLAGTRQSIVSTAQQLGVM